MDIPVDIAELMLSHSVLEGHGDIERTTRRYSSANTRHLDNRDILDLDICRGLRDKHKALIEAKQKTFVCLDRAFHAAMAMVAVIKVSKARLMCVNTNN
jgi:hypothetical protein